MSLWNKDSEGFLTPVWQIKEELKKEKLYMTVWWQEFIQDRTDTFRINQNNILINLLSTAREYNKGKKQYLNKFVKNYISKLTIDEDNELLSKLYYYLEVYDIEAPTDEDTDKIKLDTEILVDTNSYSKSEIMSELLFNNVYLPEYTNQKSFDEDMIKLIKKVENRITKFRLWRNPILFAPVSWWKILTYMDDVRTNTVKWVKYLDKWVIKSIWYKFALNERLDFWEENEFYFSININANDKNYFSREEYIRHIMEDNWKWSLMDWRDYYFWEDKLFRYSYYIWETFYKPNEWIDDDWMTFDSEIMWFEMRIYAHTKKDFNPEENLDNVCLRLPWVVENVVTDIYETYWRDKNWNTSYPSKTEYFDVKSLLNSEEDKKWNFSDLWNEDSFKMEAWNDNNSKKYKFYSPEDINYSLKDLILDDKVMESLDDILDFFIDPQFYLENNWELFNWMVLAWPPWTWKTTLAKVLWRESWSWIFHFDSNQEDSLVWESAKNLERNYKDIEEYLDIITDRDLSTWEEIRDNKAIVFIDEADTIFSVRWGSVKDFKEGMLSVQLQQMDGFNEKYKWRLTFVFWTNRRDMLDPALLSRCDKDLLLDLPSLENRIKILDIHISKKMSWMKIPMYEKSDLDLELISKKMWNKSGRFIKNLILTAHNKWLKQLRKDNKFTMTNKLIMDSIEIVEKKEKDEEKVMWFNINNN